MKFGANLFIWADHFGPEQYQLVARLKKAGFDGMELPLIDLAQVDRRGIRQLMRDNDMQCTLCSILPPGLNTIDEDAGVRARTKDHWRHCIEAAAEIGSEIIAGPLYAPVGFIPGRRRTSDEWNWAVESFRELGPDLDAAKVTLAIEPLNRYETYFLNTTDDTVALCEQIGHNRIGMLFDTYHANIEERDVAGALRRAARWLKHFHSCENDRGTPGSGHTDWAGVSQALRDAKYDGWLVIESFGFSLGALSAAASVWRDLAPSSDAIAFEGLAFLKSLVSQKAEVNA